MMFTVLEMYTKMDVTKPPIFPQVRTLFNTLCATVVVIFIFQLKSFTLTERSYEFSNLKNKDLIKYLQVMCSNSSLNSDK